MAAGLGGVCQYLGWLIFMYKIKLKIRFDVLVRGGGGFMKNIAVTFSIPKLIYEWPQTREKNLRVEDITFTQLLH